MSVAVGGGHFKNAMLYTGIDHHKRYSVACTLDESGRKVAEARIEANDPQGFAAYFSKLGEPSRVMLEACWNWGPLYDLLEQTPGVAEVILSHPAKNRIIAEAQNKNDRVDARALATLLRGNFFAGTGGLNGARDCRGIGAAVPMVACRRAGCLSLLARF